MDEAWFRSIVGDATHLMERLDLLLSGGFGEVHRTDKHVAEKAFADAVAYTQSVKSIMQLLGYETDSLRAGR